SDFSPDIMESEERYESGKVILDGVERPWIIGFRDAAGRWWQVICQPTKPHQLPADKYIPVPKVPEHESVILQADGIVGKPAATAQRSRKNNRKEADWHIASENVDAIENDGYLNSGYASHEWSS